MLLVPTYLARSPIHGVGVFTPAPLRRGTVLWEFTPGVDLRLAAEDLDALPEVLRTRMATYCYRESDDVYVLCGDNAKFMNHSEDPSCDDSGEFTVARRELSAGEELTCDYRDFDLDLVAEPGALELELRSEGAGIPGRGSG